MAGMMTIGQILLGRYEVVDLIAEGGQASLAKGLDQRTGRSVAVKRLEASPGQANYEQELARFQRAGGARIGHPAVVDPLECREEDGQWYMVMPFIDGVNLEQCLAARGGRLGVDEALALVREVAAGLQAIHDRGYVHRDLKSANIMIDRRGYPHILDLGICRKVFEATITQGSGLVGTLYWMAPEQVARPGSEDHRSDWYSLGAIFYYMLTGAVPVRGDDVGAVVLSICEYVPPPPRAVVPAVPPHVSDACMALLAKRPEERIQDAEGLSRSLEGRSPKADRVGFCPSCGTPGGKGARYCSRCGAEFGLSSLAAVCLACGGKVGEADACPHCSLRFRGRHRLLFTSGALAGRSLRIPEGTYVVGREELCPRDQHISRRHLHVACLNGSVLVADAGSTNKTYVAGRPADALTPLVDGVELYIGGNTATYTSHQERSAG